MPPAIAGVAAVYFAPLISVPAPRLMSDLPSQVALSWIGVNVRQRGVQREAMTCSLRVKVLASVAALSLPAYHRQRGGYVIAGVVVGVHAPIDGEKILFTCLASITATVNAKSLLMALSVSIKRRRTRRGSVISRYVADAGNIQRTARAGAVGGDDGAAVAVGQVCTAGAVRPVKGIFARQCAACADCGGVIVSGEIAVTNCRWRSVAGWRNCRYHRCPALNVTGDQRTAALMVVPPV